MKVDDSGFSKSAKNVKLSRSDMLSIEGAGAAIVQNTQKTLVPVLTAATKTGINSHIITATDTLVEDEIGPETDYAPVIEYGRKDMPNYPIQPFIRPSAFGNNATNALKAISTAFGLLVGQKWR